MAGERRLIIALSRIFGPPPAPVRRGIGDDTAILALEPEQELLWTIDTLIEGVHFDLRYTPLRSLGWKSLAVNLSDIAAMGGEPQYALLALGWPPSRDLNQALELAQGMQEVAKAYTAACTPDFFLFGPARTLVYRGQLDGSRPRRGPDRPGLGELTGRDLRAALDAVLAGAPVDERQLPSIGYNIKWKPGNEPAYFG